MPKPDAYLVQGTTITPVEIQNGSAFNVSMAVRPVGSTDTYRRVMAVQVHDTLKRATVDVKRYLARQRHEGMPRRQVLVRYHKRNRRASTWRINPTFSGSLTPAI